MCKTVRVFTVLLALGCGIANAQTVGISVTQKKDENARKRIWEYTFRFSEIQDNQRRFEIRLPLPKGASWNFDKTIEGFPTKEGDTYVWTILSQDAGVDTDGNSTIKLTVSVAESQVKEGILQWGVRVDSKRINEGTAQGPVALYDPSMVRPFFSGGLNVRFEDHVDFKVENDTLLTVNDSRARAAAQVGVLFKIADAHSFLGKNFDEKKVIDLLVSLEFAEGTTETLDGFTFGLGIGLNQYVEIIFGYTLRKGQELSLGFRREAARIAREQQAAMNPVYSRFLLNADQTALADVELYDGFPLNDPSNPGVRFFPGDPITESFNSSFSIGIAIPLDLGALFRKEKK